MGRSLETSQDSPTGSADSRRTRRRESSRNQDERSQRKSGESDRPPPLDNRPNNLPSLPIPHSQGQGMAGGGNSDRRAHSPRTIPKTPRSGRSRNRGVPPKQNNRLAGASPCTHCRKRSGFGSLAAAPTIASLCLSFVPHKKYAPHGGYDHGSCQRSTSPRNLHQRHQETDR